MSDISFLRAGWLCDLPRDFADAFINIGRRIKLDRGQLVYGNATNGTDLFGVTCGVARMHASINEQEQRLVHIVGPGFWFGDYGFVSGTPRIMEVEAATELQLLKISRRDFEELALEFPDAWKWIALLAVQHQNLAIGAADDLMVSSAESRLAAVLLRLSGHRLNHQASPPIDVIPATQQELAVAANLSRASAGRILREFEKSREIAIGYGGLTVRNPVALKARLV